MISTQEAYNNWARTYDTMANKTRDLEATVKRKILGELCFDKIVELGCGTGKNTGWLAERSKKLTAVDFSEAMLLQAREKNALSHVQFKQADITKQWDFEKADLITCSLILEHIKDLDFIFQQAASTLNGGGSFYICELHPYKQLLGGRARFESPSGLVELEYFIHYLSDYFQAAKQSGFICSDMQEWFDNDYRNDIPRLASFLFEKPV